MIVQNPELKKNCLYKTRGPRIVSATYSVHVSVGYDWMNSVLFYVKCDVSFVIQLLKMIFCVLKEWLAVFSQEYKWEVWV